ncbi:MAG: DUF4381 domain-containing protein [Pseudomonadota bacterium]
MNEAYQGLSLVELIDLLNEVPAPPPVAMTPQTPGWFILALLFVVMAGWLGIGLWRHWRSNAYRRAALAALTAAGDDAVEIATILRRTALVAYPRAEIVPLSGEAWLNFLDQTCPGADFVSGPGRSLATAPFRSQTAPPELRQIAMDWVRRHRSVHPA